MYAKHARILSLLEMSAVMLGTAGEVSVPVIQATPDTNVKNLVRILKALQSPPWGFRGSQGIPGGPKGSQRGPRGLRGPSMSYRYTIFLA